MNLYISDLNKTLTKTCKTIYSGDDKLLFSGANDTKNAVQILLESCQKLSLYFTKNHLKLNIKKTELVKCSEKLQGRNHKSNLSIILDDNKIEEKPQVKYLEVRLDYFLNFQIEVKNMLRKMACEIKTFQLIKKPLTIKNRLFLMNAFVINILHYPAILIKSLSSNLIFSREKQLSWAIKTCSERRKFDFSSDLKLEYKILPVSLFLDWNSI